MSRRIMRGVLLAAALAIVIVAVYRGRLALRNDEGEITPVAGEEETRGPRRVASHRGLARTGSADRTATRKKRWARRFSSEGERRRLLELLRRARSRSQGPGQPGAAPSMAAPSGSRSRKDDAPGGILSKEYIRSTIQEAIPLVRECYDLALHENPGLGGKLIVRFEIAGEPEVGGLVEQVDIEGKDEIARQGTLKECLEETIYSLQFPKPTGGGHVIVNYPFIMRQSGRKQEQAPGQFH